LKQVIGYSSTTSKRKARWNGERALACPSVAVLKSITAVLKRTSKRRHRRKQHRHLCCKREAAVTSACAEKWRLLTDDHLIADSLTSFVISRVSKHLKPQISRVGYCCGRGMAPLTFLTTKPVALIEYSALTNKSSGQKSETFFCSLFFSQYFMQSQ
jgi:hypothetical protein